MSDPLPRGTVTSIACGGATIGSPSLLYFQRSLFSSCNKASRVASIRMVKRQKIRCFFALVPGTSLAV